MMNNFKRVMALILALIMLVSNFSGICFAADNMATIEFRHCGHGQIIGPERIEVTTGSAITVSDAYATTLWAGNTDPAAFLYWVLSDPNGQWLHVEGETFIPTEAKTYTFDLVPMYGRFKVRYESNGATGGTVPASSMTYADNSSNELLTVVGNVNGLTRDGYIFSGWNTSSDGSGTAYSAGDSIGRTVPQYITHLYAVWTPKPKYTVNYTCDDKQGSITKTSDEVLQGSALVLPQITAKRGWRSLGWCSDDGMIEKLPGDTIVVTSNLNLKAVFVPARKLAFNYDANGADSGIAPKDDNVYYAGDAVTLKSNEGNLTKVSLGLKGWNTKADGTGVAYAVGAQMSIADNTVVYAQWAPLFTMTYACETEKGVSKKQAETIIEGGTATLPEVTAKRGWNFIGWRTEGGTTEHAAGSAYNVTQNITMHAVFTVAQPLSLKYDVNSAEKGTAPVDQNAYYTNENAVVANNTGNMTKTGFVFECWNSKADGSGTNYQSGQKLVMSENVVLFAKWKASVPATPTTPTKPAGDNGSSNRPEPREKDTEQTVQKPTAPVVKVIPKEETPLGKLNAEDHFAYMSGYPDKTFRPNGSITRAEIAMILFRLLEDSNKDSYAPSKSSFTDVKVNSWYGKSVLYLCQMGVLKGDGKGKFNPNAPISRAELATVISKFYQLERMDGTPLTDINGHWAEAYICSAFSKKWITAYADGTYRPDANMSRVDTLTLINNALGRKVDKHNIAMNEIVRFTDVPESYQNFEGIVETTNSHLYQLEKGLEVWNSITDKQSVVSK